MRRRVSRPVPRTTPRSTLTPLDTTPLSTRTPPSLITTLTPRTPLNPTTRTPPSLTTRIPPSTRTLLTTRTPPSPATLTRALPLRPRPRRTERRVGHKGDLCSRCRSSPRRSRWSWPHVDGKGSRIVRLFGFGSHSHVPATADEVHCLRPGFLFLRAFSFCSSRYCITFPGSARAVHLT